jgi:hypothetical protein
MLSLETNNLSNHIAGWVIDDTSLCDDIIAYFNDKDTEKRQGKVHFANTPNEGIFNEEYKIATEATLNNAQDLYSRYQQNLQKCLNEYVKLYEWCDSLGPYRVGKEGTKIQYYPPGGGYFSYHSEKAPWKEPYASRHLVFMTYLNDVDDGGETEFLYQRIKVKPKKGLTLIWPAEWTHTHRGITSLTQEKYITTGWFNFDDPI